jgi:hypothetical protein
MALKIKARSFFMAHVLKVTDTRVIFQETAVIGGTRKFNFGEICYILLSAHNVLSFQVGNEVFSIPMNPNKPKHQQTLDALLAGVRKYTAGFPVQPPPPVTSIR